MPSLISRKSILDTELNTKEAQINAIIFDYLFDIDNPDKYIWVDEKTKTLKINPETSLKCFDPFDNENYTGIWCIGYDKLMKLKNLFDIDTINIPNDICRAQIFLTIDLEGNDLDGFTFINKIELINVNKIRNCTFKKLRYGISFSESLGKRKFVIDFNDKPNYKLHLNYDDSKYNNPQYLKENGLLWSDIIDFETVKFEGNNNAGININMKLKDPRIKSDFKNKYPHNNANQYVTKNLFIPPGYNDENKFDKQLKNNVYKFFYEKYDYLLPFYIDKETGIKKCIPFHINYENDMCVKVNTIDKYFYLDYISRVL